MLDLTENAISETGKSFISIGLSAPGLTKNAHLGMQILFEAVHKNASVLIVNKKQGGAMIEGQRELSAKYVLFDRIYDVADS
jgi:hypothetical protein